MNYNEKIFLFIFLISVIDNGGFGLKILLEI